MSTIAEGARAGHETARAPRATATGTSTTAPPSTSTSTTRRSSSSRAATTSHVQEGRRRAAGRRPRRARQLQAEAGRPTTRPSTSRAARSSSPTSRTAAPPEEVTTMSFPEDQVAELKQLCPDVQSARRRAAPICFFRAEPPGRVQPRRRDALLCPTARDGYASRLFFAERVESGADSNWNANGVRIVERNWHAYTWKTNPEPAARADGRRPPEGLRMSVQDPHHAASSRGGAGRPVAARTLSPPSGSASCSAGWATPAPTTPLVLMTGYSRWPTTATSTTRSPARASTARPSAARCRGSWTAARACSTSTCTTGRAARLQPHGRRGDYPAVVTGFRRVGPAYAHGIVLLARRRCAAWVWLPGDASPVEAGRSPSSAIRSRFFEEDGR